MNRCSRILRAFDRCLRLPTIIRELLVSAKLTHKDPDPSMGNLGDSTDYVDTGTGASRPE